jgi:hypothetical protein
MGARIQKIWHPVRMTRETLAELLERVTTWSEEAKQELATSIVDIEAPHHIDMS